jgi:hypothetical protein
MMPKAPLLLLLLSGALQSRVANCLSTSMPCAHISTTPHFSWTSPCCPEHLNTVQLQFLPTLFRHLSKAFLGQCSMLNLPLICLRPLQLSLACSSLCYATCILPAGLSGISSRCAAATLPHSSAMYWYHCRIPVWQQMHIKDKGSNVKGIWDALRLVHVQQVPGMRFSAYNKLFSVAKGTSEMLPTSRISAPPPQSSLWHSPLQACQPQQPARAHGNAPHTAMQGV